MRLLILTISILLVLSSCGTTHSSFSKWKYTKGHFWDLKKRYKKSDSETYVVNSEGRTEAQIRSKKTSLERRIVVEALTAIEDFVEEDNYEMVKRSTTAEEQGVNKSEQSHTEGSPHSSTSSNSHKKLDTKSIKNWDLL